MLTWEFSPCDTRRTFVQKQIFQMRSFIMHAFLSLLFRVMDCFKWIIGPEKTELQILKEVLLHTSMSVENSNHFLIIRYVLKLFFPFNFPFSNVNHGNALSCISQKLYMYVLKCFHFWIKQPNSISIVNISRCIDIYAVPNFSLNSQV